VKTKFDQLQVAEIMIVPLVEGNTMVLIKTNAGSINSTVVTDIPLTDSQADDASAALNSRVRGLTLKEMFMGLPKIAAELKKDLSCFETLCKGIGSQLEKFIKNNISRKLDTIKLLEIPDYNNIEKIRKISIAVNDDEAINKALESDDSVVIGAEVDDGILGDSSIVKFNYKVCGENIASIGLIGPERIDYKNLIIALYALLGQVKERRLITGGASPGDVKRKHDKTG
jgi:heat-inducible transcriptional repressor